MIVMKISREVAGKVLMAFGALLVILAMAFDFFYFAVILVSLYFFYTLYRSRKGFSSEIILVAFLMIYMFFLAFFVLFMGFLGRVPPAYTGAAGVLMALTGLYLSGYLKR